MSEEPFIEQCKYLVSDQGRPLLYLIIFALSASYLFANATMDAEFRQRWFNISTMASWGLFIDIIGFLMLRAEWRLALSSPQDLAHKQIAYLKDEIAKVHKKKEGLSEEEADKPRLTHGPRGSIQEGLSLNQKISAYQDQIDEINRLGPQAYTDSRRKVRFEVGSALILIGFGLQFLSNYLSGQGA